uniref:Photosystem I reaction center subunit IX n=1 Tax=Palmophyllum crassum TaxID=1615899 RepID=A0A1L7NY20_9VIRI|nr:subunit IX of photosystem I [Palmophyllum crassum]BAW34819.1 subunit IX of photosystem I [Palmophyllum crassum]
MKDFQGYLSTAPVYGFLWCGFLAGLLIEINRFFPDGLIVAFF